jgi:hypothetical protein
VTTGGGIVDVEIDEEGARMKVVRRRRATKMVGHSP